MAGGIILMTRCWRRFIIDDDRDSGSRGGDGDGGDGAWNGAVIDVLCGGDGGRGGGHFGGSDSDGNGVHE